MYDYISQWHHAVVIKRDGSITVQHTQTVDKNTHKLVHRYGRPYFWREKDPAMHWDGLDVAFEPILPFGLIVRPAPGTRISWSDVPMDKMRSLAGKYALILARGFGPVDKDEFSRKAGEMGTIQ